MCSPCDTPTLVDAQSRSQPIVNVTASAMGTNFLLAYRSTTTAAELVNVAGRHIQTLSTYTPTADYQAMTAVPTADFSYIVLAETQNSTVRLRVLTQDGTQVQTVNLSNYVAATNSVVLSNIDMSTDGVALLAVSMVVDMYPTPSTRLHLFSIPDLTEVASLIFPGQINQSNLVSMIPRVRGRYTDTRTFNNASASVVCTCKKKCPKDIGCRYAHRVLAATTPSLFLTLTGSRLSAAYQQIAPSVLSVYRLDDGAIAGSPTLSLIDTAQLPQLSASMSVRVHTNGSMALIAVNTLTAVTTGMPSPYINPLPYNSFVANDTAELRLYCFDGTALGCVCSRDSQSLTGAVAISPSLKYVVTNAVSVLTNPGSINMYDINKAANMCCLQLSQTYVGPALSLNILPGSNISWSSSDWIIVAGSSNDHIQSLMLLESDVDFLNSLQSANGCVSACTSACVAPC